MSFQLSILTPAGKAYEDTVDSVSAPGIEGGFTVMSKHMAFVAALKDGQIKVKKGGSEQVFATASGILEVMPDHNVLILVDSAN